MQREKIMKERAENPRREGTMSKGLTDVEWECRKEKRKGVEEMSGITIVEDFLELITNTKPQIRERQRTPSRVNSKKNLHQGISCDRRNREMSQRINANKNRIERLIRNHASTRREE